MSQNKVYEALLEIGGEGTTTELREHLDEKYPESSLPEYATNRVRKLQQKGIVEIDTEQVPFYIRVVDHDWDGIRDSLANRDFPPE